jgi:hypothetical protein
MAGKAGIEVPEPPLSLGTEWLNDLLVIRREDWEEAKKEEKQNRGIGDIESFLDTHGVQI